MRLYFRELTIDLSPEVCHTMFGCVQKGNRPEAGGILLGKFIPEHKIYYITEATTPNILDRRGTTFFVRRMRPAQKIINKRWKESCGKINYLGEWHTHGCDTPIPSETDRNLVRTVFSDKSNVWPIIIMIILGREACYVGVSDAHANGEIDESRYIEGEEYARVFNR